MAKSRWNAVAAAALLAATCAAAHEAACLPAPPPDWCHVRPNGEIFCDSDKSLGMGGKNNR